MVNACAKLFLFGLITAPKAAGNVAELAAPPLRAALLYHITANRPIWFVTRPV